MTLQVGEPAPDFELPSQTGEPVKLSDERGHWVVVYFYPADDTPGCTAEACSFRDNYEDFTDAGATVIGISGDSVESHVKFAAKHNLPFTLLSDGDGELRKSWGVGKSLGILPGRVTYVIDPEGVVRKRFSSQLRAKQHHQEALAAIPRRRVIPEARDASPRRREPTRLAVLDMAGTTVRDDGLVERAFVRAMETAGVASDDPAMADHLAFVHSSMGLSKIEVFRALLGDETAAASATGAFEHAIADAVEAGEVTPIDGAEAALRRLRGAGVRICLTTGFSADTQALIVAALDWSDLVDLALAPGAGLRGRPHPDMVLQAVLALQIDDVAAVASVGDTTSDLLSGWRAGAGVVAGVLTGAHRRAELEAAPHTHLLASVADLPELLLTP